jgi:hypothetical protein
MQQQMPARLELLDLNLPAPLMMIVMLEGSDSEFQ